MRRPKFSPSWRAKGCSPARASHKASWTRRWQRPGAAEELPSSLQPFGQRLRIAVTTNSDRRVPYVAFGGIVVVLALLLSPASASAAQRFWLSPSGSDANAGTEAAPFAGLPRAQEA